MANVWFVVKVLLWYFFYQVACTCGFYLLDWVMETATGRADYFGETFMLSGSLFLSALLITFSVSYAVPVAIGSFAVMIVLHRKTAAGILRGIGSVLRGRKKRSTQA